MPTDRFYRRRFLNKRGHHAGAYVIAAVRIGRTHRPGDEGEYVDASIRLADCGRIITLDFNVDNKSEARNALRKAHLLRDVLDGFIDALDEAIDDAGYDT